MKDIKTFLIGFLTCSCLFLIMGQTSNGEKSVWDVEDIEMEMNVSDGTIVIGNENGRYQAFGDTQDKYLVDTATGRLFNYQDNGDKWYSYQDTTLFDK